MKINSTYRIIIVFLFIGNIALPAYSQLNPSLGTMKYKITIVKNYFGRPNNRIIVTEDSVSYETKVYKGNNKKISRLLTHEEKESLVSFLKDFPLNEIEEGYVNNEVKDGTQISFSIKINDNTKESFIANAYQENLGRLVAIIVPMLPEDFIQYRKELIYPY